MCMHKLISIILLFRKKEEELEGHKFFKHESTEIISELGFIGIFAYNFF